MRLSNTFKNTMNHLRGISLIELMLSIFLAGIISLGLFRVYLQIKEFASLQIAMARMQEHARLAAMILQHELRDAAYWGCRNSTDRSAYINHNDDIHVYQQNGLSTLPDHAPDKIKADSDLIGVIHLAEINASVITSMTSSQSIQVSDRPALDAKNVLLIADCQHSETFTATKIQKISKPAMQVISSAHHLHYLYEKNTYIGNLSRKYFFIRATTQINQRSSAIDALYEKTVGGQVVELVPGVEQMKVLVGVEGSNNKIQLKQPSQVKQWKKVVFLKIYLLMNSINPISNATGHYYFMDKHYSNSQHLLHKEWDITIVLANRAGQQ